MPPPAGALADRARAAMRARVETGEPFLTSDLSALGMKAGQTRGKAGNTASNLIQAMKAEGLRAVDRTGVGSKGPNVWRLLTAEGQLPALKAPVVVGPYDPAVAIEGPNSGLTEAFAEKLWRLMGGGGDRLEEMQEAVSLIEADGWRRLAHELLTWIFDRGFVGPGGPRRARPGLDYAWVYACAEWAITDADGGHVALISDDQDVPLFLAAPRMRDAIQSLLLRYDEAGGVKKADIEQLRTSLPVKPEPKEPE